MEISQYAANGVLDKLLGPLMLLAPDGAIVDVNSAALDWYGFPRDEMLALHFDDLHPATGESGLESPIWKASDTDVLVAEEHRRSDGTLIPVELRSVRLGTGTDAPLLVNVHEVARLDEADEAERASEAKHSAMIANISDVLGIMGVDGIMKYKSPNIEKWFGWRPEDLVGTDGWLTVHPDDIEGLQKEFYGLLQTEGASVTVEYRYLCKDQTYCWIELTATNMVADPHVNGVLLNYHDISSRKQVELLDQELSSVIDVIGKLSEIRDPYTAGHQRRVSELASALATDLGMSAGEIEDIRVAGLIHDIGKMSVPVELLAKPTTLTPMEFSVIMSHAEVGYSIISSAHVPGPIAELVFQHHERCDGSGYPRGMHGDELLDGAKILMVADVVEAMMSHRPYRPALGQDAALSEISEGSGETYDSDVVDSCVRLLRDCDFAFSEL